MGHLNGFVQSADYTLHLMNAYGGDDKTKYKLVHLRFLKDAMDKDNGHLDVLDWLMSGKHYSRNADEEMAY